MHMSTGRSPQHHRPILYLVCAVAVAALCGWAALDAAPAHAAGGVSLPVHYYNGASRVDLALSMDELYVTDKGQAKLAPSQFNEQLKALIGDAQVASVDPQGRRLVSLATAAGGMAELEAQAATLRAAGLAVEAVAYPLAEKAQDDATRIRLTNQLVVKVPDGEHINPIAARFGLKVVEQVAYSAGTWILEAPDGPFQALEAANAAYESGETVFAYPLTAQRYALRFEPNDPLFPDQWHLRNTGQIAGSLVGADVNIVDAWDMATGEGVNIVVVDDGVEESHPDLAANMRPDLSFDFFDTDPDPSPGTSADSHGTSVSGVAAAVGDNDLGVIGSGFEANIIGARLVTGEAFTDKQEADALSHQVTANLPANQADVSNNSWGIAGYYPFMEVLSPLSEAALRNGVTVGRGGKGVVYLFAAGNYREYGFHVSRDARASSRYTIAVAASGADGAYAYYSDYGPALLVNAPSSYQGGGITTTDLVGAAGSSPDDYTNDFGGTSSATPLVSGIVALMLDANPELTWRDVQHILVDTSTKNDPKHAGWFSNASGRMYNVNYGFGRVDATAAVTAAADWVNVPPEATPLEASDAPNANIPDGSPNGIIQSLEIESDSAFFTEHVEVIVDITHAWRGDLELVLTSPSGTAVTLLPANPDDFFADISQVKFTSVAHWGEDPNGEWTLRIADMEEMDVGTLNEWSISIYGFESETATDWSVAPQTGWMVQGPEGGPFSPALQTYTITNDRATAFDFEVQSLQPWITVTPPSGTVAPGATADVTLSLNESADELLMGPYFDTVTFHNVTDDEVVRRTATLRVTQPSGTRPMLLDVLISPLTPTASDDLAVTFTYFSPVGRQQKTVSTRWYRNDEEAPEYANLLTLPAGETASGEMWRAEVRVSDGIESSRWVPSNSVQVVNASPVIEPLDDITATQRDVIVIDVIASDPDGDDLLYAANVPGAGGGWEIDPATGKFTWDTAFAQPGSYTVMFTVTDDGAPPLSDAASVNIVLERYCPPLEAPAGVQASDGQFDDRVRVTYDAVEGADGYRIYRAESNDKAAATLLGSWAETMFDDFSAAAAKQTSTNPFACAPSGSTQGKTYYYWVAAYSDCTESPTAGPDAGYAGSGGLFGKDAGVYEKALPSRQVASGLYKANGDSELAVRLRSDAPIDPDSAWAEVVGSAPIAGMTVWYPVSDTDGWVVFWPAEPLETGALITVAAGASTVDGAVVSPEVRQFSVGEAAGQTPEAQATLQTLPVGDADTPPSFAGSVGAIYAVAPAIVFDAPQRVWLPVPAGVRAEQLAAFYYLEDGDASAWHPARDVEGWLVPGSEAIEQIDGVTYYGIEVRHGGVVQLGAVNTVNAATALPTSTGAGFAADLALLGFALLTLWGAGRRYARAKAGVPVK